MGDKGLIRNLYMNIIEQTDGMDEIQLEMKEELLELIEEDQKQMDDEEFRKYRDKVFQIGRAHV